MRKILITIVVIAVIAVGAYFIFSRNGDGVEDGPQYREIHPERGPIAKMVGASGSVTSNLDVEIKCKASGEIIMLPFDSSDTVHEGDLLVELDPVDEERNVELAEVNLYEAQARLNRSRESHRISEMNLETSRDRAEVDLELTEAQADDTRMSVERIVELYERGFISEEEYEQSLIMVLASDANVESANIRFSELEADEASLELLRQDVNLASSSVQTAQINLDRALQRLDETRVYSPMDGVVTVRYVQTGQIIASGISNTGGGTPVMMISDLSRLFILARVDESNIGEVEVGQRVDVTVDAYSSDEFKGVVERIAPVGTVVSNVVTFEVRIEVTSENKSLLMPEMTADVEIVLTENDNALLVPANAVTTEGGRSVVMVRGEDGQPEEREVVKGINNGEYIEIISGLREGDTVLMLEGGISSMWQQSSNDRQGSTPSGTLPGTVSMPMGGGR